MHNRRVYIYIQSAFVQHNTSQSHINITNVCYGDYIRHALYIQLHVGLFATQSIQAPAICMQDTCSNTTIHKLTTMYMFVMLTCLDSKLCTNIATADVIFIVHFDCEHLQVFCLRVSTLFSCIVTGVGLLCPASRVNIRFCVSNAHAQYLGLSYFM